MDAPQEDVERPTWVTLGPGNRPFIHSWARAATADGSHTPVLVCSPSQTPVGSSCDQIRTFLLSPQLRPDRLLRPLNDRLRTRSLATTLSKIENEVGEVRVVHSHFLSSSRGVGRLRRRGGWRWLHTEHSSSVLAAKRPNGLVAERLEYADTITAVGSELANRLSEQLNGRTVEVIPNPIPPLASTGGEAASAIGSAFDRPLIVSGGNFVPVKNHELQLELASRLREYLEKFTIAIAGEGPLESRLQRRVSGMGLANHVKFVGALPHQKFLDLVGQADALLHTAHRETFGVVIAEALSLGVPVVTTPCGGVTEYQIPHMLIGADSDELAAGLLRAFRRGLGPVPSASDLPFSLESVSTLLRESLRYDTNGW